MRDGHELRKTVFVNVVGWFTTLVIVAEAEVKRTEVEVPLIGVEVLFQVSKYVHIASSTKAMGRTDTGANTVTVEVCVAVRRSWVKVKSGPKGPARLPSCCLGGNFTTRLRLMLSLVHPEILRAPLVSTLTRALPAANFM